MTDHRPRRSCLYMPASNERALDKAKDIPADVLIFDLEDAVAPEKKAVARANAVAAASSGGYGNREIVVRINALDSAWGEADLAALADADMAAILAPKVSGADDALNYIARMDDVGFRADCRFWAMIEMPSAILDIANIAALAKTTRLAAFALGFNDLAKEIGTPLARSREVFAPVLLQIAIAAKAHGVVLLDSVFNDFRDEAGLRAECEQARDLGFDGKSLIHPAQVAIANAAFAPSNEEIVAAEAIVAAYADPENAGSGAIQLDGKMVERLHLEQAEMLLARAAAIDSTSD